MSLVPLGDSQDPHTQAFPAKEPILCESAFQVDSRQSSGVSYSFRRYPQDQETIEFYPKVV